jgi:O-antigen ligase
MTHVDEVRFADYSMRNGRAADTAPGRPPFRGILAWRPDAVSLLSLIVFGTFVIPARYIIHGFGAVGTPTNLLGIGAFFLWIFARLRGSKPRLSLQPVRILVAIYLLVMLLTYAGGFARGMFSDERSNATRFIIATVALTGVALLAADGIPNRERLSLLLQRLVYGAAFMAFAGDLEFFTKYNLASHMHFPGLVLNTNLTGLRARGDGFDRVAGTATHYIEFGVVLGMILPLAIHFAIFSPTKGRRQLNWLFVLLIGIAVPFSLSRAAAISLIVGLVILAGCWTWRARANGLVVAALVAIGLKAVKPGLLGTIRALFTNVGNDPSITGRTDDYGVSFALIGQRPLFGRGAGTFIPSRYRFLDNQILMTAIESGIVGLAALVMLFIGGSALAHRVGKFASDPETKHLGYALLGAFVSAFLTSFTFDSLSFPIFATMLFFMLGVAGALWRLDRPARQARHTVESLRLDESESALAHAELPRGR